MSRMDNDSLEDFFRKATQHPDLQFNEDDWSKMEKKLDEQFGKPVAAASRGRVITLVALVAALGVLTLLLWRSQGDDFKNLTQDTQPIPQNGVAPSESTPDPLHTVDSRSGNLAETHPGNIEQPLPPQNTIVTSELQPELPVTVPASSGFNQERTDPQQVVNAEDGDDRPGTVRASDQPVNSASAAITADAPDAEEVVETDVRASDKAVGHGRFGISIIAAPDFSMTTNGGAIGHGEMVGIMLHYQVFNRWGISAGAMYNTKKYWGPGDEYHPPSGYWNALTNGVVPNRVDGACALYEIPVSVTFDVVRTKRSRLFASAGLSSYFMQNEDYYYKFDTPNPGSVTGWSGDKPTALWFGIGTLSMGYDFKATRSLSFGVEPYFKVPLEGIGWADIDLYSTGLMFAARYHFMKNGNKHPPPSKGP